MKKLFCLPLLLITLCLGGCNNGNNAPTEPEPIVEPTYSFDVSKPTKLTYYIGEELDLTGFSAFKVNENNREDVTSKVNISGFDSSKEGTVTVVVTYEEFRYSFEVEIISPKVATGINLIAPERIVYYVNDELDLTGLKVELLYSDDSKEDITDKVTLSEVDITTPGEKEIVVSYLEFEASFTVTYLENNVYAIYKVTLSEHNVTIMMEHTFTLEVSIDPVPENVYSKATFTSSNDAIATIKDGVISPTGLGKCFITATYEDGFDICEVTVNPFIEDDYIHVANIDFSEEAIVLNTIGEEKTLDVNVSPNNATDKSITYTSNDESIVSVTNNKVKAIKAGSTIIKAETNDNVKKTSTIKVIVKNSEVNYGYNYYNNYYGELTWSNSSELKDKLYTIIRKGYEPLKYANATNWETNQYADQDLYLHDYVDIVYSNDPQEKSDTYNSNAGWQREHAFAASLMCGTTTGEAVKTLGRATDFHNLFAAYNSGNGSRSNKNFGYANKSSAYYTETDAYRYDKYNFEPSDYDKGRLSRAIFYMGVMYGKENSDNLPPLTIQEDYVEYDSSSCQYAIGNLSTLIEWNSYNVDYVEYQHNESVYSHIQSQQNKKQGNRNPFVDYPDLVDYVYGPLKDQSGDLALLKPTCVNLNTDLDEIHHYAVSNLKNSFIVGETLDSSDYSLVGVKYDLSEVDASSEVDLTSPYTFTEEDVGKKEIEIKTNLNTIKLTVKVTEPSIESCAYQFNDVYDNNYQNKFTNKELGANKSQTVDLDGENWTFTSSNTVKVARDKAGLKFGTGTAYADTMDIESEKTFSNIDAIYLKLNTAANKTYKVDILVGDNKVDTITFTRTAAEPTVYGANITSPVSGKVKFHFYNVSAALYLAGFGINYQ